MIETAVIPYESTQLEVQVSRPPEQVIQEAQKAAAVLKSVIASKPKPVIINGEQYIEFEDWQTIGKFYGLTVQVISTRFIEYGEVKGFEASAQVIHVPSGRIVSGAEAMCLNDEARWGDKPLFQLRSMAQTRACAKAFRNVLAWVVVLAGYRPTPAEEMDGVKHVNQNGGDDVVTEKQLKMILVLEKKANLDDAQIRAILKEDYQVESHKNLTKKQASALIERLQAGCEMVA